MYVGSRSYRSLRAYSYMIQISQIINFPPGKHVQIREITHIIPGQTCMQYLYHTYLIYLVKHVQITQVMQIPPG